MFTEEEAKIIIRVLEKNRDSIYQRESEVQRQGAGGDYFTTMGSRIMYGRAASKVEARTQMVSDALARKEKLEPEDLKWIVHLLCEEINRNMAATK